MTKGNYWYGINDDKPFFTEGHSFESTNKSYICINPDIAKKENIIFDYKKMKVGDYVYKYNYETKEKELVRINKITRELVTKNTHSYGLYLTGDRSYYANGYAVLMNYPLITLERSQNAFKLLETPRKQLFQKIFTEYGHIFDYLLPYWKKIFNSEEHICGDFKVNTNILVSDGMKKVSNINNNDNITTFNPEEPGKKYTSQPTTEKCFTYHSKNSLWYGINEVKPFFSEKALLQGENNILYAINPEKALIDNPSYNIKKLEVGCSVYQRVKNSIKLVTISKITKTLIKKKTPGYGFNLLGSKTFLLITFLFMITTHLLPLKIVIIT